MDLAVTGSSPAGCELFSTVNGIPLHTDFHYHPSIVLICDFVEKDVKSEVIQPSTLHPKTTPNSANVNMTFRYQT